MLKKIRAGLTREQKRKILLLLYAWRWPRDILYCFCKGLPWSLTWRFYGLPLIQKRRGSKIIIGKWFVCTSNPKHNSIGLIQKTTIKTTASAAEIIIGEDTGVSGVSISSSSRIEIGSRVLIGSGSVIIDSDAHPLRPNERHMSDKISKASVVIGDDCFIGARSFIMKGVTIGPGSVIGACSVVVSDIPSGVLAAGNPAKVIRPLE